MADFDERTVAGLRVRIDRTLCVGFGDCVKESPEAFALDGENVVVFATPDSAARDALLRACASCPVDALTVWTEDGQQLVP
jgi:ferredoxin